MNNLLDLAKNFEQTSNEQAKVTKQTVSIEYENHKQHLIDLLNSNEQAIKNAIQEQNRRLLPIMLKTWSVVAIAIITILLVAGLTLAWQGKTISKNLDTIAQQKATMQTLADAGGNLDVTNCIDSKNRKRLCIKMNPQAGNWKDGYQVPMGY